jgi:hypothetical protein
MSERRTVKTVLQYEVDTASLKRATDSANQVEAALKGIDGDFSRLGSTVGSRVDQLRGQFKDSIRTVRDELQQVQSILGGGGTTRGQSPFARAGQFGRELRALPAVQLSGNLSTDAIGKIIGVAGTSLDKLGVSVAQFGVGAVAATVLTVGFVLAMERFNKAMKGATELLEGALGAQNNYYKALAENTTEQVRAQRDQLQQQTAIITAQRDETQRAIDETFRQLAEEFGDAGARALVAAGKTPITQLQTQLDGLNGQISVNTQSVSRYTEGLQRNAFVLNDIAAQFEADTNIVQKRSDMEAETLRFLENATRQSADERVRIAQTEINRLLDLNAQLAERGGETADKLIALNNARILENQFVVELTGLLRGVSDRRSDLINAFNIVEGFVGQGIQGFVGGIETVGQAFTDLQPQFEIYAKITKEQADSAAKLAEITRQQSDAEAKALVDRNSALEEAAIDRNTALQDQEREHKQALLEINRRANASIANAIGDRDALAAFMAQETRREELSQQKRDNKEALRRIEATFKEQQRVIDKRYAEQLAAARSAAQRATEIERARLQVQVDALNQQLANQRTAAGLEVQVKQETNNAILTGAINLRNDIIALWGGQTGTTDTGTGSTYTGPANSGLTPTEDMVYYRQAGAIAASRTQQRRTASDGVTVGVTMVGQTDAQIARTAGRATEEYINKLFQAAKQKQARAL